MKYLMFEDAYGHFILVEYTKFDEFETKDKAITKAYELTKGHGNNFLEFTKEIPK